MRKYIVLILFLFLTLSSRSQVFFSELNIRVFDDTPFTITVDNQVYGGAANRFSIGTLFPGNHYISIVRQVLLFESYNIPKGLCFSGIVSIPQSSQVYAYIDKSGAFRIAEVFPLTINTTNNGSINFNSPPQYYNSRLKNKPDFANPEAFNNFVIEVKDKIMMSERLPVIKHALTFNKVLSSQVVELITLLSFESEKIDAAKFAYYFTADKENYQQVYSSFSFSSSGDEVKKYVTSFF